MTLQCMCSLHRNHLTLILVFQNISGNISMCVAENSFSLISLTNSAYLETMLFQLVVLSASTSFSFFQEILDGRVFLSLILFSPLHPRTQGALHNFCTQSRPCCSGNRTDNRNTLRCKSKSIKLRQCIETIKLKNKITEHDNSLFTKRTGKLQTGLTCHRFAK